VGTHYLNIGYINYVNSTVFVVETVYCEVGTHYLNIGYINYVNSTVFVVETVYCEVGTHYLNIGYINFVFRGRIMGQEAAGLSPRRAGLNPRLVYVTSVVDKVALRRVSLRIVRLFPGIFQQCTAQIFTLNTILIRRTSGRSLGKIREKQ